METNAKSNEAVAVPQSQESKVRNAAFRNGYDLSGSLQTHDGDIMRVVALDLTGSGFPIVGEITEISGFKRLARFNVYGTIQAQTMEARKKHSLKKNLYSDGNDPLNNLFASLFGGLSLGDIASAVGPTVKFQRYRMPVDSGLPMELVPVDTAVVEPVQDEPAKTVVPAPAPEVQTEFMKLRNEFDALQDHVLRSVGTRLMTLRDDVDANTAVLNAHRVEIDQHTENVNALRDAHNQAAHAHAEMVGIVRGLLHDVSNLDVRVARAGK